MNISPQSIIEFVITLWQLFRGALGLDITMFELARSSLIAQIAVMLIFAAGVSEGIGTQTAVLFVNRIPRRTYLLNLMLSGVVFVFGALAWILSIWLIASMLFDVVVPFGVITRVVSLGYFPLLFGFFILAPYVGPGIARILHVWSFIIVLLAVQQAYGFQLWQAFVCSAAGWLVVQLLRRIVSRPLVVVNRWLWRRTTGLPKKIGLEDIPLVLERYVPPRATSEGSQR